MAYVSPDENRSERKVSLPVKLMPLLVVLVLLVFGFQFYLTEKEKQISAAIEKAQRREIPAAEAAEITLPEPRGGTTPKETLLQALGELKTTQNSSAIYPYVWWESVFQKLRAKEPSTTIRSARGLYQSYLDESVFRGTAVYRSYLASLKKKKHAEEERHKVRDYISARRSNAIVRPNFFELRNKLIEIRKETVDKDSATIDFSISDGKKLEQRQAHFLKVQDKWLFDCVVLVPDPFGLCSDLAPEPVVKTRR